MKIAKKIGFPVVAKVVSAEILHKSDIGGVVLNIKSAAEGQKACNDITARGKRTKGKPKQEGSLGEKQGGGARGGGQKDGPGGGAGDRRWGFSGRSSRAGRS